MIIFDWVCYFFFYGFIGWLCEVIYCSIFSKKLVNRGFLYAPICPIYGYGAIFILLILYHEPLTNISFIWAVFLLGGFVTSLLEYITSYCMEKIFKLRWWDYSKHKFNIQGRVCLLNSTMFAILSVVLVYLVHPFIEGVVVSFPNWATISIASTLFVAMVIDTVFSCIKVGKLNKLIEKCKEIKEDVDENYSGKWSVYIEKHFLMKFPRLQSVRDNMTLDKMKKRLFDEMNALKEKLTKNKKDIIKNDMDNNDKASKL